MRDLCDKCHLPYDTCNCYPSGPMPGDLWYDDASYIAYQSDPGEPDYPDLTPTDKFCANYHPYQFNRTSLPNMLPCTPQDHPLWMPF